MNRNYQADEAYGLDAALAEAKYSIGLAEQVLKDAENVDDLNYAAHVLAHATPDQVALLSKSSTVALVRKAIEAEVLAEHPYDRSALNQQRIDLANLELHYRNLRADYNRVVMGFWGDFAESVKTLKKVYNSETAQAAVASGLPMLP